MYRYKIKSMFKRVQEIFLPQREVMIRQSNKISHITLSPLKQMFLFTFLIAVTVWSTFTSYTYLQFEEILEKNKQEVYKAKNDYKKLVSEVSAYGEQLKLIDEKLAKNLIVNNTENLLEENTTDGSTTEENTISSTTQKGLIVNLFKDVFHNLSKNTTNSTQLQASTINAQDKERLKEDVVWLGKKLDSLSSGKTTLDINSTVKSVDVKLSKAELQRDLALSEAKNLRNKVNEMDNLISEMQKTQVVVFDKVAKLADDGISDIERKLSGVKDALNNVGLGFDTLLARVDIEYANEVSTGGPFIPVSFSTPITPDLKNEVLNVSLNNLVGGIDKWNNLTKLEERLPIGKPLDRIRITSRFGTRQDPFTKRRARHDGLDFGGIRGEPVYTTAPGKIIYAGMAGSFGYMVEIDHGLGIRTRYAHLGSIEVKRGEQVSINQKIATMGNTGRSTGVHLHYEIRIKGKPLDPLKFVRINRNVSKKY